jgi:hypothetical protein
MPRNRWKLQNRGVRSLSSFAVAQVFGCSHILKIRTRNRDCRSVAIPTAGALQGTWQKLNNDAAFDAKLVVLVAQRANITIYVVPCMGPAEPGDCPL